MDMVFVIDVTGSMESAINGNLGRKNGDKGDKSHFEGGGMSATGNAHL